MVETLLGDFREDKPEPPIVEVPTATAKGTIALLDESSTSKQSISDSMKRAVLGLNMQYKNLNWRDFPNLVT